MNPSSSYVRRPQGVPVVYVLVAVVAALLAGMFIGKSGAAPEPQATQVAAAEPAPGGGLYDPKSGSLTDCRSENRELIAALDRAGGDSSRFRDAGSRSDDSDRSSYDSTRSDSAASGRRTSFGGPVKKEAKEPIRQTANVRVWAGRTEKLANRPDVRASGSVFNRESVAVEGILHVTLHAADGTQISEASSPMMVQPGRTEWEHVFRWVPDDRNARYSARVTWETLTY